VRALTASAPLRLLLAALLVASPLWAAPVAARRERGDTKSVCTSARIALRPPAGRGAPDFIPPSAALPSAAPLLPVAAIVAAHNPAPAIGVAPERQEIRTPPARAPPLPA
jgi:hypothetical protein